MINSELNKRILSALILLPMALFFISYSIFLFTFFILICFFITLYEWHRMTKKKSYYLYGLLFLLLSFYSAYEIKINVSGSYDYFIIVLLICVFTDIGGYIFGNLFKGPKLTKISPKKTYSGVIGGYLLSITLFYIVLNSSFLLSQPSKITSEIFLFILLISTVSQIGDIIISYFKRLSKIKDTGKIIPGHGGLLDRIDGMIFAYPSAYLILKINLFEHF